MTRAWPLFDLAVVTPRLRLEYATNDHLEALAEFRDGRVVGPGEEPFDGDSSFYGEGPAGTWKAVTGEWGARARTSATWWHLAFAVLVDGELVGQQNITAAEFPTVRTVSSFSFLDRACRGTGIGKEMRAAVLHLAFAGLGALRAESDAFADNHASAGVSRALGYEPNGTLLAPRPSGAALMDRYLLTRERWEERRRPDIELLGVDGTLPVLGLA
jgi:RimJ/RimL family protein N-acetyltransferase